MVTTRSQVIGVNRKPLRGRRDRAASLLKGAPAAKTIVQKRHLAAEKDIKPTKHVQKLFRAPHILAPQ